MASSVGFEPPEGWSRNSNLRILAMYLLTGLVAVYLLTHLVTWAAKNLGPEAPDMCISLSMVLIYLVFILGILHFLWDFIALEGTLRKRYDEFQVQVKNGIERALYAHGVPVEGRRWQRVPWLFTGYDERVEVLGVEELKLYVYVRVWKRRPDKELEAPNIVHVRCRAPVKRTWLRSLLERMDHLVAEEGAGPARVGEDAEVDWD